MLDNIRIREEPRCTCDDENKEIALELRPAEWCINTEKDPELEVD